MDHVLSEEDSTFRKGIQKFIKAALPHDIRDKVENGQRLVKEDYVRWQRILSAKGWLAPAWPEEFGGTNWTPLQRYLFEEELALAAAPRIIPFGVSMVAPVIIKFGSLAQKTYFLPRILNSEDWWCQGYSEPGAGSDLASLSTKAITDDDYYIVNGAKTWTTLAQYADMMFCLVRTSNKGKPQEGISFLLIDMRSKGISVRPIRTIDGRTEINDVFFKDVKVPKTNLIGEENKGWTYAKYLLGHERTGIASIGRSKKELKQLKKIAAHELAGNDTRSECIVFNDKIADLEINLLALESLVLDILGNEAEGQKKGAEASILKIKGTEIQQKISELMFEAIGYHANPYIPEATEPGWNGLSIGPNYANAAAQHYFDWRKVSIYGGTNEIQKNIIAKFTLGL